IQIVARALQRGVPAVGPKAGRVLPQAVAQADQRAPGFRLPDPSAGPAKTAALHAGGGFQTLHISSGSCNASAWAAKMFSNCSRHSHSERKLLRYECRARTSVWLRRGAMKRSVSSSESRLPDRKSTRLHSSHTV